MTNNPNKILVVEDNEITRKMIVGILTNNGYQTMEAGDGLEALKQLDKKPALILLDIQMEPLGGFGFMRKVALMEDFKTPVVLITADEGTDILTEAAKHRIRHVLAKPIDPDKLLRMVASIMARAEKKTPESPALPNHTEDGATFMRRAIEIAQTRMEAGYGGPFGAVVVKGGQIVGEGWDAVTSSNDPTAHAVITAIRNACRTLESYALPGHVIFTNAAPCGMCRDAAAKAQIDTVHFANTAEDVRALGLFAGATAPDCTQIPTDTAENVLRAWQDRPDKKLY